jgi:chromosomal replication initiator protein
MKANFKLNSVLNVVSKYYDINIEDIKGRSRKSNFVNARQVYMYVARNHSNYSFPAIGYFVNKDHATALHSVNKISIEKEIYSSLKNDIEKIEAMLYSTMIPYDVNLLQMSINNTNFGVL